MKRRSFFGAMAGLFGVPAAAAVVSKLDEAFPAKGELVEAPAPVIVTKTWIGEDSPYTTMSCAYSPRPNAWRDDHATRCGYCKTMNRASYGTCTQCGAPVG